MKRFHVHVSVADLPASIRFYSALFAAEPSVTKDDYAKWMLEDPRINFAISRRGVENSAIGVDHLGFQVETDDELQEMHARLAQAELPIQAQPDAQCCYAKGNKYWSVDPQGVAWESYHTLDAIPTYGTARKEAVAAMADGAAGAACCAPASLSTPKVAATCGATTRSCC